MDLASYKVWLRGDLAWYPVRKAANSSIQNAWRGEPVDLRCVPEGIQPLIVVRSPFDRLASLWAKNRNYPPLRQFGSYRSNPWEEFVVRVCETVDPLCDNHVWAASHVCPKRAEVFYFEDLTNEILRMNWMFGTNLTLKHIGKTKTKKPFIHLDAGHLIARRYSKDLERFYENDTDPIHCRARGKTKAQVRQEEIAGASGFDSLEDWIVAANNLTERRDNIDRRRTSIAGHWNSGKGLST